MRLGALLAVLVVASGAAAFPLPRYAPPPEAPVLSPAGQLRLAVMDLAVKVRPEEAPFVVYVSFAWPPPGMSRSEFRRAFRHEFNKRNGGTALVPEVEIDGPNGTVATSRECTLAKFLTTDCPNWTRTAWRLVADRDYLFRESPYGLLPHRETVFGRLVCGVEANEKTLAAGFIVNAAQLFRDMIELARSQTGHDLLYAYERHPDADGGRVEFKGVGGGEPRPPAPRWWPGGDFAGSPGWPAGYYPPRAFEWIPRADSDAYERALKDWKAGRKGSVTAIPRRPISIRDAGKGRVDFPATLDEFQARWGVKRREEKLKIFLFDPAVGGIALGADSGVNGSTVAAGGDRVVSIDGTEFGVSLTTNDSFESVDGNDQIERDQFLNITKGVIKFDGGEALCSMPLGGQAEFLFNAEKKSVNIADTRLAKHLEVKSTDPRYPDVRVGFCAACHASSYGYNPFVEVFADLTSKGIKFNVYPEDVAQVRGFYQGWQRRVKRWRLPYEEFVEMTTADERGKPWTGAQTWQAVMKARDAYDKPVGIEEAAREFGWKVEDLRQAILGKKEEDGPVQTRLNTLAIGRVIPRRTWEKNTSRDLATWLDLVAPQPDPLKDALNEKFLADALRRFGHKGVK